MSSESEPSSRTCPDCGGPPRVAYAGFAKVCENKFHVGAWEGVVSSAMEQTSKPAGDTAGELLPCPFCGGKAEPYRESTWCPPDPHSWGPGDSGGFICTDWIRCTSCGVQKYPAAWNRRAPASPPDKDQGQIVADET